MKGGIAIDQPRKHFAGRLASVAGALVVFFAFTATAWAALPAVYAGGQSIGVLLKTEGVTVVGLSPLKGADGGRLNPAEEAGLAVGDFIVRINGQAVNSNQEISAAVAVAGASGNSCQVEYQRSGVTRHAEVEPYYCRDSESFRIGLYVRDNTAGVGTLTFWEPNSGRFGALGHAVSVIGHSGDEESTGAIIRASVEGIRAGGVGSPGEKLGVFADDGWQGQISSSGAYGVYGSMDSLPAAGGGLLAVAEPDEVKVGAATLYTVVSGETTESFTVEIVRLADNYRLSGRGMVIRVTDQRLLDLTGGIIQGMSGSPLVQNGKLIGAVTHVFVNDPSQGYACFARQMLEEAGLSE